MLININTSKFYMHRLVIFIHNTIERPLSKQKDSQYLHVFIIENKK